jgi:hypothetical protein
MDPIDQLAVSMSGSAADPDMLNLLQVQVQQLTSVIEQMRAQLTVQASEVTAREEHIQHLQQSLAAQQAVTHVSTANATITRLTSQLRPAAWAGNRKHDFDTWLFQADQYRNKAIAAIDDATAIVLVSMHFTDDAATWWRAIVESGRTPATWNEFKQLLTAEYRSELRVLAARDKLANARMLQGLEQYVTYVRSLHLAIGDLSEGEKMDRFLRGLKPKLQERLRAMRPHARTFDELVQRALVLDDAERAASASTRAFPSGGNFRSYTSNPAKAQQHPRHADSDEHGAPMELGSMSNGNKGKFRKDERGENRQHRDIANDRCFNCNEKGHHSKDCKKPKRERRGARERSNEQ